MPKNRSLCLETLVRRGYKVLNRNRLFLQQS
jgi:DNA-binding winged helix-turn-helix (wHTH) protein